MNDEQILIDAIGGDDSPKDTVLIFIEKDISMWKTVVGKKNVICENFIRKNFDLPPFNNGLIERGLLIIKRDDYGDISIEAVEKNNEYGDYWWDWGYSDSTILSGYGMSSVLGSVMDKLSDGDDRFNITVNFYTQSYIKKIMHKYLSRLSQISQIIDSDYKITTGYPLSFSKIIII